MISIDNANEILSNYINGFHIYNLQKPYSIAFVSNSFCQITGIDDLNSISKKKDKYIKLIHPKDREVYKDFLCKMSMSEQTSSVQYRLVLKDKKIITVNDTMTSKLSPNGEMLGYSTLSDVTQIKNEKTMFEDGNPCGFLKLTCDKHPRITYLNDIMRKMLRIPENKEGELDYLELYKSNFYLAIPIEERKRFHYILTRVIDGNETLTGEVTLLRCDGSKARILGWASKQINDFGEEEIQCVCMDISTRYMQQKESEIDIYVNALEEVYDKIFEYDYASKSVKYLFGKDSKTASQYRNMPVRMDDAIKQLIQGNIEKSYHEEVQKFFSLNYQRRYNATDFKPLQIRFKAKFSDGIMRLYSAIFFKINLSVSLLCIKKIETDDNKVLITENENLKARQENIQKLFMRLNEGIVAFEINNNKYVKILHTSENVCRFMGRSKDELEKMSQNKNLTLKELVEKSDIINYEKVMSLIKNGEAEFPYFDIASNKSRRIKAICTQESIDEEQSRYVILYTPENNDKQLETDRSDVYIRTFGYFDVFVKGKPIPFKNKKSKELLAFLIDRRGGFVTSEEAISVLWEDEDANSVTLARYRKVALRLKNILEEYGISDIVETIDGKRRIDTSKVVCDLFDFLSGDSKYAQLFKGSYLTNYSWAESTLSELLGDYYN